MGTTDPITGPVVLFDGVCNLCNGSVQFIINRDPHNRIRFAALQSRFSQHYLQSLGIPSDAGESIVLIKNGRFYQRSNAVLEISRLMGGLWPMLYIFKIIPSFIRDWIYNWVARNRYRWFGRKDHCMIPSPALSARFLD